MTLLIDFVTETYPPEVNGVAMTIGRLVNGLRAHGHRVRIVRPQQSESDRGNVDECLVTGFPIPGYPSLRIGLPARRRLKARWQEKKPDLVHVVTEGPLGWSAVSAARDLGIPVTSGFHTNFDHYSDHYGIGWLKSTVAHYLRAFHRRTQATLAPTKTLAAELSRQGVPGVQVVGRGVDTTLFDPQHRCNQLRQSWGAGADTVVCLYVGRLAPEKNLVAVRNTFAAIQANHVFAKMVWVGDGPSLKVLSAELPDHHFAGIQKGLDLARHYASADLFLFPSLTETYGNVVPEAMASGLAVVAYNRAAAAELIISNENGVLAPPGDEPAFIEAALRVVDSPRQRSAMGQAARKGILSNEWDSVINRFVAVANDVTTPRR